MRRTGGGVNRGTETVWCDDRTREVVRQVYDEGRWRQIRRSRKRTKERTEEEERE